MAILEGLYNPYDIILRRGRLSGEAPLPPLQPNRVKVTATPQEYDRIGALPGREHVEGHLSTDGTGEEIVTIPPDRDLVRQIARKVEVDVPDTNLIDWMARDE